ncbi:MAG: PTS sugar transporter subunit IIB [Deltaproteobacteria bacterium]|jgi:PTS system mannose-specific IIB component|nr:PTS sugar transporter subunit IIB [Deltaproteobacteria bacterium]
MIWYRIDNRLIHGQIIEAWLPYTRATRLVVANNQLAVDPLRQQIVLLAVPSRVCTNFAVLGSLPALIAEYQQKKDDVLVLFANCQDARAAFDLGLNFEKCNIGNLPYSEEKRRICSHVAVSADDEYCLRYLEDHSVILDFRSIPADVPQMGVW